MLNSFPTVGHSFKHGNIVLCCFAAVAQIITSKLTKEQAAVPDVHPPFHSHVKLPDLKSDHRSCKVKWCLDVRGDERRPFFPGSSSTFSLPSSFLLSRQGSPSFFSLWGCKKRVYCRGQSKHLHGSPGGGPILAFFLGIWALSLADCQKLPDRVLSGHIWGPVFPLYGATEGYQYPLVCSLKNAQSQDRSPPFPDWVEVWYHFDF